MLLRISDDDRILDMSAFKVHNTIFLLASATISSHKCDKEKPIILRFHATSWFPQPPANFLDRHEILLRHLDVCLEYVISELELLWVKS